LSIILTIALHILKKISIYRLRILAISQTVIAYYLSLQLLNYGFEKLFKGQFYLPEPNILYTPLGMLDKDILFWSMAGVSYEFNMFSGIVQVLAGLFLLFNKTRLVGFLCSLMIFINIVAINFSFDISLKLYASFLLFLSILGVSNYIPILYKIINLVTIKSEISRQKISIIKHPYFYPFLKSFIVLFIFFEVLYSNIATNNYNDDTVKRQFLHGAYQVLETHEDRILLSKNDFKRVFIHRMNYIIFQDELDQMSDYKLEINQAKQELLLTDYNLNTSTMTYNYAKKDSLLILDYIKNGKHYHIKAKTLDWKKLPLLKSNFHLTIDAIE
jgi:hypothetical protein